MYFHLHSYIIETEEVIMGEDAMSYEFRDFIFDLSKEALKQEQVSTVRQQCDAMRKKAAQLSGEDRQQAFSAIDEYEHTHLMGIESNAASATVIKEILKIMGY